MSELDGICHDKHEPINIDAETRDRLWVFLNHQAPKGMGYTAFIEWALNEAQHALTECNDDGSLWCMTHQAQYVAGSDDGEGNLTYCEVREDVDLSMRNALHARSARI